MSRPLAIARIVNQDAETAAPVDSSLNETILTSQSQLTLRQLRMSIVSLKNFERDSSYQHDLLAPLQTFTEDSEVEEENEGKKRLSCAFRPPTTLNLSSRISEYEDSTHTDTSSVEKQIEILKELMMKPAMKRTDKERQFIWKYMKQNAYFAQLSDFYPEKHMIDLCRNITVESFTPAQKICSQGDTGKKFYVVLQGETVAFSRVKRIQRENLLTRAITRLMFTLIKQEFGVNPLQFADLNPIKKIEHLYPDQIQIGSHKPGQYFGEIALRNDCPRTASIFAKTHLLLAVIHQADYRRVIREFEDQQLELRIQFLQQVSIFAGFSFSLLQEIWYLCEVREYFRNDYVYDVGDPVKYLYIIFDGTVTIKGYVQNRITKVNEDIPAKLVARNAVWKREATEKLTEETHLGVLGKGQYFGEYEMEIIKSAKRSTCAQCDSTCTIYAISKNKLLHFLAQSGHSRKIKGILSLRKNHYKTMNQSILEEREKLFVENMHDDDIEKKKVIVGPEDARLSFNKMRLFTEKSQYLLRHLKKRVATESRDYESQIDDQHVESHPRKNKKIWKVKCDTVPDQPYIMGEYKDQLMEFFDRHEFKSENAQNIDFLMNMMAQEKNHHLVRMEQFRTQVKKGKPKLRESMGEESSKYIDKVKGQRVQQYSQSPLWITRNKSTGDLNYSLNSSKLISNCSQVSVAVGDGVAEHGSIFFNTEVLKADEVHESKPQHVSTTHFKCWHDQSFEQTQQSQQKLTLPPIKQLSKNSSYITLPKSTAGKQLNKNSCTSKNIPRRNNDVLLEIV